MEPSPPWEELSKLGEYIVTQLGDPYQQNLVVHWMAHQLAEYLKAEREPTSESERVGARRAATDLIIRLWQVPSHWPYGWPPLEASQLKQLLEDQEPRWQRASSPDQRNEPWWDAALELDDLQRQELRICRYGAIAELDTDAVRTALDAAPASLTDDGDDDLAFMKRQLALRSSIDKWFAEHAQPGENPSRRSHRAQIIERELVSIDERRHDLIRRAAAHAQGYRRRSSRGKGPSRPSQSG